MELFDSFCWFQRRLSSEVYHLKYNGKNVSSTPFSYIQQKITIQEKLFNHRDLKTFNLNKRIVFLKKRPDVSVPYKNTVSLACLNLLQSTGRELTFRFYFKFKLMMRGHTAGVYFAEQQLPPKYFKLTSHQTQRRKPPQITGIYKLNAKWERSWTSALLEYSVHVKNFLTPFGVIKDSNQSLPKDVTYPPPAPLECLLKRSNKTSKNFILSRYRSRIKTIQHLSFHFDYCFSYERY